MSEIAERFGYYSPFLEEPGFNRTTKDISNILNQDIHFSNAEILNLIDEGELEIKKFRVFIDSNKNKVYDKGVDTLKYRTVIFFSENSELLKNAFKSANPNSEQILVFINNSRGDNLDQAHFVKIGEGVRNNLEKNKQYVKLKHVFEKYSLGDSEDVQEIQDLIKQQSTETSNWDKLWSIIQATIHIQFNNFKTLNDSAISILDSIIKKIESNKIEPKFWNPEILGKEEFEPFFMLSANKSGADAVKKGIKEKIENFKKEAKRVINEGFSLSYATYLVPGAPMLILIKSRYENELAAYVDQLFDKLLFVVDDILDFIGRGVHFVNAILCGLINSILEVVSGVLQIVKLLFTVANGLGTLLFENTGLLEKFDTVIEAFKKISFTKVTNVMKGALAEVWGAIDTAWDEASVSVEEIGYFIGYIIGFILEIIIGVLFTGGLKAVHSLVQKTFVKSRDLINSIIELISKQFVKFGEKSSKKIITQLSDFLKKGTDNLLKIIAGIKEKVLKFFYKNKYQKYAKVNGIFRDLDFEFIYRMTVGREVLTKKLILSLKEVIEGKSIKQLMKHFKIKDPPGLSSLSLYQARIWYTWKKINMDILLIAEKTLEAKAKKAFELRNTYRTATRNYMKDRDWANYLEGAERNQEWSSLLDRVLRKKDIDGDLTKAYKRIIESSKTGRDGVDNLFNIKG